MNNNYYILNICLIILIVLVVLYLINKNHTDKATFEPFISTPIIGGIIGGVLVFIVVIILLISKISSESKKKTTLTKFKNSYWGSKKVHPEAKKVNPSTLDSNEYIYGPNKGFIDPKNPDNFRKIKPLFQ